jgi:phosphohistidine swiveling domain-containing protein
VPYFAEVDGVVAYFGGLLSDASIILREVGIPAITQLPASQDLPEGTWIEIDGCKGSVRVLTTPVSPASEFKRNLSDQ